MTIFLTVGLHEQPFDRLVKLVDELDADQKAIQYGYSKYVPRAADAWQFLDFDQVRDAMVKADVVITHGGTGSIMLALSVGKKPIAVPRYKRFNEHVDDHQEQVVRKMGNLGLVYPFLPGDEIVSLISCASKANVKYSAGNCRSIDVVIRQSIDRR